jgi:hypothetical protein
MERRRTYVYQRTASRSNISFCIIIDVATAASNLISINLDFFVELCAIFGFFSKPDRTYRTWIVHFVVRLYCTFSTYMLTENNLQTVSSFTCWKFKISCTSRLFHAVEPQYSWLVRIIYAQAPIKIMHSDSLTYYVGILLLNMGFHTV